MAKPKALGSLLERLRVQVHRTARSFDKESPLVRLDVLAVLATLEHVRNAALTNALALSKAKDVEALEEYINDIANREGY